MGGPAVRVCRGVWEFLGSSTGCEMAFTPNEVGPFRGSPYCPVTSPFGFRFWENRGCAVDFVLNGGVTVPWVWLAGAISLEVVATLNLKLSEGFTRFWPSVVVVLGYIGSFSLLGATLKKIDVGTVYAIWSGAG